MRVTEPVAYKGPGFRLRHKVAAYHAWDGPILGYERAIDLKQREHSWQRRTFTDKATNRAALLYLANDVISHDRRLTGREVLYG